MRRMFLILSIFIAIPLFGSVVNDEKQFYIALEKRGDTDFYFTDMSGNRISMITFQIPTLQEGNEPTKTIVNTSTSFMVKYVLFKDAGTNGVKLDIEFCASPTSVEGDAYMLAFASDDAVGLNFDYTLDGTPKSLASDRFTEVGRDIRTANIVKEQTDFVTAISGSKEIELNVSVEYDNSKDAVNKGRLGTYKGYAILTLSSI